MIDFLIIGAGASGMAAAITAGRAGVSVLLLEQKNKVGKKLLATGNGMCNFTNSYVAHDCYTGDLDLFSSVYPQFDNQETIRWFASMGIPALENNGSCLYPRSQSAASVVNAMEYQLYLNQVMVRKEESILSLDKVGDCFQLKTKTETFQAKKLLFATGLLAQQALGSDGSAFPLIEKLGHSFGRIYPALTGLYAQGMDFSKLSGCRVTAGLSLVIEGKEVAKEVGQVQMTDYGLSGIPVFQLSRIAVPALLEKKKVEIFMDFLPDYTEEAATSLLLEILTSFGRPTKLSMLLNGILPQKLILELVKAFPKEPKLTSEDRASIKALLSTLKSYAFAITKAKGYDMAQACGGGILSSQIDRTSLESKLCPGLYFAGELLDLVGKCGGYNLQWAFSSGVVAARHAIKDMI